jgi:hypothetical protein
MEKPLFKDFLGKYESMGVWEYGSMGVRDSQPTTNGKGLFKGCTIQKRRGPGQFTMMVPVMPG